MRLLLMLTVLFATPSVFSFENKFINMKPPAAKAAQQRQVQRMSKIRAYKALGSIGETDNALLSIHEPLKVKPAERAKIKKLVDDENKDRKLIYKEIIKANKIPAAHVPLLIKSVFEVYRNTDAKGTFYLENKMWQKHP